VAIECHVQWTTGHRYFAVSRSSLPETIYVIVMQTGVHMFESIPLLHCKHRICAPFCNCRPGLTVESSRYYRIHLTSDTHKPHDCRQLGSTEHHTESAQSCYLCSDWRYWTQSDYSSNTYTDTAPSRMTSSLCRTCSLERSC